MNNKAFTLIELLAVIVILAILSIISVPLIFNLIIEAKESTYEQSVNSILNAVKIENTLGTDILFKYENGSWDGNELKINGAIPKYIEASINSDKKVKLAVSNGEFCALKDYNSDDIIIKKIGKKNDTKTIMEKNCVLNPLIEANDECFKYTLINNEIRIDKYYSYEQNNSNEEECPKGVIIPSEINGIPVTRISEKAFASKELTNIEIPETIVSIYGGAFNDNLLSDDKAFIYNRKNDGSIDYTSLNSYGGLNRNNIIIPEEVNGMKLKKIGIFSLKSNKLTGKITIPSSVTDIYYCAFCNNNLTSVEIPNSVTNIDQMAFSGNTLSRITIPNSVKNIGYGAFSNNQLDDENAFIYNRKNDGNIDYTSLNSYGGLNRDNVIIPNGVLTIGNEFCPSCQIKNLQLPDGLREIGFNTFTYNYITDLTLPESLVKIDQYAFANNKIKNIIIPKNVEYLGYQAFNFNELSSVVIMGKSSKDNFEHYNSPFGLGNSIPEITYSSQSNIN